MCGVTAFQRARNIEMDTQRSHSDGDTTFTQRWKHNVDMNMKSQSSHRDAGTTFT